MYAICRLPVRLAEVRETAVFEDGGLEGDGHIERDLKPAVGIEVIHCLELSGDPATAPRAACEGAADRRCTHQQRRDSASGRQPPTAPSGREAGSLLADGTHDDERRGQRHRLAGTGASQQPRASRQVGGIPSDANHETSRTSRISTVQTVALAAHARPPRAAAGATSHVLWRSHCILRAAPPRIGPLTSRSQDSQQPTSARPAPEPTQLVGC
jgi:hypothetical protein